MGKIDCFKCAEKFDIDSKAIIDVAIEVSGVVSQLEARWLTVRVQCPKCGYRMETYMSLEKIFKGLIMLLEF